MKNINQLKHKKMRINGKMISVSIPTRKISWNEFVKETKPIVKKWLERPN
jgi:hypothetical protein